MIKRIDELRGESLQRILILTCLGLLIVAQVPLVPDAVKTLIMIFSTAAITVTLLVPGVMWLANRFGAMDYPGGRRIHTIPTPRWGGIAVYGAVIFALLIGSIHYMPNLKALLIGSTLILAVGLYDDVKGAPALTKLLVQVLACVILLANGIHVTFLTNVPGGLVLEWIITTVWILGITNAINFLDGMDGLVSGLVAGTSLIYFALSMLVHSPMLAYCSIGIFGAAISFLGFNIKPARIFLGDGGSNFLGFYLATMSVQGGWSKNDPIVSLFIPILVLSVPIYDMTFTTISRIATGKVTSFRSWLEFTGRDHLHHRLEALGLSRAKVVLTIWFLNLAIGLGAITLFEARTYGAVALIAQAVCVYITLAILEIMGARKRNQTGA